MAPFVSFIIPSIGRASLDTALDSLREQSDPDWEALVVADPRWWKSKHIPRGEKKITYLNGKESSAGLLRNHGLQLAYGQWVAFRDDDDTISPNYVEHLREHAEDYPGAGVVVFRMEHPKYGILPRENLPIIAQGLVGISYAVKRQHQPRFEAENVVSTTDTTLNTHEDINLLLELRKRGLEFYISPHVDYKVGA
jgi:glycosyltransferase involved in cell wall biosynthesis